MKLLTYLLVRLLAALYALIPARRAYGLGRGLGRLLYPLFPKRRRLSVDNILRAHITADPQEADRIARAAFGHLAGHICEAMKIGKFITPENWHDHFVFEGPEGAWKTLAENPNEPVMIVSGHLGTWESAVPIISAFRPMIAVARTMNNKMVEKFMKKEHFRGNIEIVDKDRGFTPAVIRRWKQQCAALTLVADQHAGRREGMAIDFLGRPASTHTSPARLHLASGAPILVGAFIREGIFKYRMIAVGEPIRHARSGDREADTRAILTEINRRLGELVRRYPEQYLWAHRRWRLDEPRT